MAIICVAGKQYLVQKGDSIQVNKLTQKDGESFKVADMLGGPELKLTVKGQKSGEKIDVLKFKKKKGYKRVYGSKALYSIVEVS